MFKLQYLIQLVVLTNQNSLKHGFLRKSTFAAYKILSHTFEIILFIEHGYTTAFTQIDCRSL